MEQLLTDGVKVTYVTAAAVMGEAMGPGNERAVSAYERFLQLGEFEVLTRHHLVEIEKDQVLVRPYLARQNQVRAVPADTVVLITPNEPLSQIYDDMSATHPNMTLVGDALQPRDLLWAIWEGHRAARAIA
jgi:hypothetical protein